MRNDADGSPKRPLNVGDKVKIKVDGLIHELEILSYMKVAETDQDDLILYTATDGTEFYDTQILS